MPTLPKRVTPDSKGRITLGQWAKGVSSFAISRDEDNRIILEPYIDIPAHEKWVYKNKAVHEKIKRGIKDAVEGRVSSSGDFRQYVEDDSE